MMKEILITIITAIYTLITWPERILNRRKSKDERQSANYRLLRRLIKIVMPVTGVKLDIRGIRNIKKGQGQLIIANHKSNLDSLILIWIFEEPLIFIGKEEIKKIPFLSTWFKEIGCLFIERNNLRQSVKVIAEGSEVLKSGKSVVIFPEGRRVLGQELGAFKNGSFKLAVKSKKNILPIAIVDSYKAFEEKNRVKGVQISVSIGEEINWQEEGLKKTKKICEKTEGIINKLLCKM